MSTELNAEALAKSHVLEARSTYTDFVGIRCGVHHWDVHAKSVNKTLSDYRAVYAAAIREHSQPLADKLDAVTRERDELVAEAKRIRSATWIDTLEQESMRSEIATLKAQRDELLEYVQFLASADKRAPEIQLVRDVADNARRVLVRAGITNAAKS